MSEYWAGPDNISIRSRMGGSGNGCVKSKYRVIGTIATEPIRKIICSNLPWRGYRSKIKKNNIVLIIWALDIGIHLGFEIWGLDFTVRDLSFL